MRRGSSPPLPPWGGKDAEGIASGIEAAVSAFQDDATDDVAILVVRVPSQVVAVDAGGHG